MSSTVEKCALCLQLKELCESHLLPKGNYRRLRGSSPQITNGELVHVSSGKAWFSSKELKRPLLCFDCEQRFSTHGEKYFHAMCLQADGRFPLWERLRLSGGERQEMPTTVSYDSRRLAEPYPVDLGYFALSIFWRASSIKWSASSDQRFELPPEAKENLRQYLLGETALSDDIALFVNILSENNHPLDLRYVAYTPVKLPDGPGLPEGTSFYEFVALGVHFGLLVGREVRFAHDLCFIHGQLHKIFVSDELEDSLMNRLGNMLKNSSATGRLKNQNS